MRWAGGRVAGSSVAGSSGGEGLFALGRGHGTPRSGSPHAALHGSRAWRSGIYSQGEPVTDLARGPVVTF